MTSDLLESHLLSFKGASGSYPFGPGTLVFKVRNKMFALLGKFQGQPGLNLKVDPADGEELVSQFESVIPGYHMNKRHWVTVILGGDLPEELLFDLSVQSYQLVVSKMTKVEQRKLDEELD